MTADDVFIQTPIQPLPFPHGGNINAEQLHNNTCEVIECHKNTH